MAKIIQDRKNNLSPKHVTTGWTFTYHYLLTIRFLKYEETLYCTRSHFINCLKKKKLIQCNCLTSTSRNNFKINNILNGLQKLNTWTLTELNTRYSHILQKLFCFTYVMSFIQNKV